MRAFAVGAARCVIASSVKLINAVNTYGDRVLAIFWHLKHRLVSGLNKVK